MPELPEVETVRRGLQPVLEGALVHKVELRRANLRFPFAPDFAERLANRRISEIGRRAKYLLFHFGQGPVVIAHLGMSGSFRIIKDGESFMPDRRFHEQNGAARHDHVVFHLSTTDGSAIQVVYNDPRRFGFMLLCSRDELEMHPMISRLGIEPTGNTLDGPALAALMASRKTSLKAVLMDQRLIAGLGNIYVSEALWRAGLSPLRTASTLATRSAVARNRAENLSDAIRTVVADAIEAGGSTLRDHRLTDGSLGYFQHSFSVYDREGEACPRAQCSGTVRRIQQNGRSTFLCPDCQV